METSLSIPTLPRWRPQTSLPLEDAREQLDRFKELHHTTAMQFLDAFVSDAEHHHISRLRRKAQAVAAWVEDAEQAVHAAQLQTSIRI